MTKADGKTIYDEITAQIVKAIERGASGWQMPWLVAHRRPVNVVSERGYRGINVLVLWARAQDRGYKSEVWGTYRQWQAVGAQVRKGEHGTGIVYYKRITLSDHPRSSTETNDDSELTDSSESTSFFLTRVSNVFNAAQVKGGWWNPNSTVPVQSLANKISRAEAFVARTGARIERGGSQAYYSVVEDRIQIPPMEAFVGTGTSSATEAYYGTMFHELCHWSGASHRLARDFSGRFGSQAYAMEELVAELGSAFLCADLGVSPSPRADHAAYIADWLRVLKSDKRAIVTAASNANQASDYLSDPPADGLKAVA
ncbi:MAG: ArdC family protein [Methylococcales bacterium]